MALLQSL